MLGCGKNGLWPLARFSWLSFLCTRLDVQVCCFCMAVTKILNRNNRKVYFCSWLQRVLNLEGTDSIILSQSPLTSTETRKAVTMARICVGVASQGPLLVTSFCWLGPTSKNSPQPSKYSHMPGSSHLKQDPLGDISGSNHKSR